MSDNTYAQTTGPNPNLKKLNILIGTWDVSDPSGKDEISGQVRFEWIEGNYFLVQHLFLEHGGHSIRGMEIIGYDRSWDGAAGTDCTSHLFDNQGNTFTYVWDMDDSTLTIWGGERNSPAYFKGTFTDDHNTLTGAWVWPGGGYASTMTRSKV